MNRPRRPAFTLIELLVTIAIIAILIALLVPAVQKVREAATRTQCENNLHQIVIGLHGYADVNGHFPPSYISNNLDPGWGWGSLILPFLEQDALYSAAQVNSIFFGSVPPTPYTPTGVNPANPPTPNANTQRPLTIFRCPADNGPELNPIRLNYPMSNYRAIMGTISVNDPNYGFFFANEDLSTMPTGSGGIMFQNSKIQFAHITDGTSNTFVVGECRFDPVNTKWAAIWPGMTGVHINPITGALGVFISDVMWWIDESTADINGPAPQAFSSWHSNGAYFAYADGSVRYAFEGIDPAQLRWLGGRNDGHPVNFDF
jgi:prepilin-type N-terminal cleavage/methylation domain-containing protein/prepilin-type processing-associated H-X9-DG protein